jgi:acetyl-CoA C-acetyltransferase
VKIVITAARRSAIGSFLGAFADVSAVSLGTTVAQEVLQGVKLTDVADVLIGNVLQAGLGMNPARQIALGSGLPTSVPGQTINRVCGSGMQSVMSAVQAIRAGDGSLYLAGGVESMSRAPFLVQHMRRGQKLGDVAMIDSMVNDGLTDPTHQYHMGITAENVAAKFHISRSDQDTFAFGSHQRATIAQDSGAFDAEIVPVTEQSRKGPVVTARDEGVRSDSNLEALGRLKAAFKSDGTVTAGNSSSLNDGAAMLLICDVSYAQAHGLQPLAEIVSYACTGVDPALMGLGPTAAVPRALERAGLSIEDIDLFELNEAFAAQSLAVCRDLRISDAKVNVFGGAIALGHPIGASGARVLVPLAHALRSRQQTHGVASLCIGGGMGIAMVLRNADAS